MKYPFLAAVLILSSAFSSHADVLSIKKDAPKQYVVKKGDTLWDISGVYLSEPWLWPQLWQMNPQINNPHLIYPGDALALIYDAHGNPRLVINSGFKKLSPQGRMTPKGKNAIPTLPLELLRPYLTYEQAISDISPSHDMGYPAATFALATLYHFGDAMPQDLERTASLYEAAYSNGVTWAARGLAILYEDFSFANYNPELAKEWLKKFEGV